MDAAMDIGSNPVSKHQFQPEVENEQADTRRGQGKFSLFS